MTEGPGHPPRGLKGAADPGAGIPIATNCGRFNASIENVTPRTRIRADASFSKPERYVIRDNDGTTDRFRISFSGRFLTDGAVGTLRARVNTTTRSGRVLARCDSGPHTVTAR